MRLLTRVLLLLVPSAMTVDAQPRWTVDSTPAVDIKGVSPSGQLQFGTAAGATRLSNGTIAITDPTVLSVRFFSPTGQPTRSVGREGQGPGEFRSMHWIGSCGSDSVYVWDFSYRRMSVIAGASGDVVRQFRIPSIDSTAPQAFNLSCSDRRTFAYTSVPMSRAPTGTANIVRGSTPLFIVDADGRPLRQVGTVPSGEMAAMRGAGFPRPLGKLTTFALVGDRVFVGTADSAAFDEYAPDGTKRTFSLALTARPATQAHMDEAIEAIASMAPPQARDRATATLREVERPATLPPYSALLADPEGLVWIVQSFPGDATTSLRALRPGGAVAADIVIPRAVRIFEIGRDYVLGAYTDAAAEPHVALFRLRRQ